MAHALIGGIGDLDIAARTLWGEARGESEAGRIAVAWVIRNRAQRGGWWGGTVKDVCLKPWQFSAWNPGDPNREKIEGLRKDDPLYLACLGTAAAVLVGSHRDPTGGATHYHTRGLDWPDAWGVPREPSAAIGNHLFYNTVE